MIAIVNYGVGNLFSLQSSLKFLGAECVVTPDKTLIKSADKIIFPGVGAFGDAAAALSETGLADVLREEAGKGKMIMGICLGMQLLFKSSCEYGKHYGLGLISGEIESLGEALSGQKVKIPHMGWNDIEITRSHPVLAHSNNGDYVYYVHSFYAPVGDYTVAKSYYGETRESAVEVCGVCSNEKGNVFGAQFHPEKSGSAGLQILKAFMEM